ncbi:MAG: hypothetical protein IMY77_02200, partial [Chloroflexi bacterium]|nr:hypothetical protein [Chloroflexota bacterium]
MKHVKAPRLTLVCEMCGMVFTRKASRVKPTSPGRFCSARCRSKWLKKRGQAPEYRAKISAAHIGQNKQKKGRGIRTPDPLVIYR